MWRWAVIAMGLALAAEARAQSLAGGSLAGGSFNEAVEIHCATVTPTPQCGVGGQPTCTMTPTPSNTPTVTPTVTPTASPTSIVCFTPSNPANCPTAGTANLVAACGTPTPQTP